MNKLKEIGNKYYQECEVVMLATDKSLKIGDLGLSANNILWNIKESNFKEADVLYECLPQHLYLLSNEEIKRGDWYFDLDTKKICRWTMPHSIPSDFEQRVKGIIATTNTSLKINTFYEIEGNQQLSLSQPSKEFVKVFIKAYNEGKPITKVLVEMEGIGRMKSGGEFTPITYQLKVNSSNEITIKKIKDSYTREEVEDLIYSAMKSVGYTSVSDWKLFIEENL